MMVSPLEGFASYSGRLGRGPERTGVILHPTPGVRNTAPRPVFLAAGGRVTLWRKGSDLTPMATNRSRAAPPGGAQPSGVTPLAAVLASLYLYLWPAAVTPALAQQPETVHADSSAIMGRVIAGDGHEPIGSAHVAVLSTEFATTTDSAGQFAITGLGAGVFLIEIRAVGYISSTWRVPLKRGQVLTHRFELALLPYELPEVVVKGRQPLSARRFADFERRREAGIGAFVTQQQIERANPTTLVDVLVTVRGVQQVCITNDCIAKMVRSPPGCYPQYYLDGQESTPFFARHTPPLDVRGVEIYRGASETPGEFQGSNSGCGVIAIWTKSAP